MPVETFKPEKSEEFSKEPTETATSPISAVEQKLIKTIPKYCKPGARQLLNKIKIYRFRQA